MENEIDTEPQGLQPQNVEHERKEGFSDIASITTDKIPSNHGGNPNVALWQLVTVKESHHVVWKRAILARSLIHIQNSTFAH